jgi:hypothetical protein
VDDITLKPDDVLGEFAGPEAEELVLVVSRTGRSVAVRLKEGRGIRRSVARIWHPLSSEPRVEIEDRWRVQSAAWQTSLKRAALTGLRAVVPSVSWAGGNIDLEPSSPLGTFDGPEGRHKIHMVVARTGRSVAARLGDERGQVIARAHRPTCANPGIAFEGLYRLNPAEWQSEVRSLFDAALKAALAGTSKAGAAVAGGPE